MVVGRINVNPGVIQCPEHWRSSLPWADRAKCRGERDPEWFHPHDNSMQSTIEKYCADCPVRNECLRFALANRVEHGYYGGLPQKQRIGTRNREKLITEQLAIEAGLSVLGRIK